MMSYPIHSNIKDKYTGERIVYEEEVARHTLSIIENIPLSEVKAFDKPDIIIGNIGIEVVSAVPKELSKLFDLQDKQHFKGIDNRTKIQECANKLHATVTPYFITYQPVCISEDTKLSETTYQTVVDAYDKKIAKLQKGQYEKMDEYRLFIYTHYNIDSSLIQKQLLDVLSGKYNNTSGLKYDVVYIFSAEEVLYCDLKNHKLENIKINSSEIAKEAWNDIEQRMTLENLIQRYCPDGVEYKPLRTVIVPHRGKGLSKSDKDTGNTNIILYGELYTTYGNYITNIVSKCDESVAKKSTPISQGDLLLPLSSTTKEAQIGKASVVKISEPLYLGGDAIALTPNSNINSDYLMYVINGYAFEQKKMKCVKGTTIQHLNPEMMYDIEIPVPPLPVQEEIVRILDKFTELETELETELGLRKQQYEYYRDKMLSFEGRDDVDWKDLSTLAEIGTGSHNTQDAVEDGAYTFYVRSPIPLALNEYDYDDESIITAGDGVGVGKVFHITNGKYALHQRAYRIHPFNADEINTRYLYYYFTAAFYKYIMMAKFDGSVASIRLPMLKEFKIPIPDITEQNKIVELLDKFSTLTTDLTEGLPAEIKLRKQQYEYYRDKLLNFKKLEVV